MKLTNEQIQEKYKGRTFRDMSLAEQKEFVTHIPWVRALRKPVACTGFMVRPRACKNKAYWHFRGSKAKEFRDAAKTGDYCWNHLWCRGIRGGMAEDVRFERWLIRVGLLEPGNGRGKR